MTFAKFLRTPFLYRKAQVAASDYNVWCPQQNHYAWLFCGESYYGMHPPPSSLGGLKFYLGEGGGVRSFYFGVGVVLFGGYNFGGGEESRNFERKLKLHNSSVKIISYLNPLSASVALI